MGKGTILFVMLICASFALQFGGYGGAWDLISGDFTTLSENFGILLASGVLVGIVATTLAFPNSFALFAGIAGFLLGFFTFPASLITESALPDEYKVLISLVFGVMYLLVLISWFKGGGEF